MNAATTTPVYATRSAAPEKSEPSAATSVSVDATARTVAVAVVAALLTTPLDVARTRVLLRTAPGAADAGPPALAATLAEVAAEGSLFSGAALRVAYTGVVVAAFIPLRTLFYVGLRDWIILDEVFQFDAIT